MRNQAENELESHGTAIRNGRGKDRPPLGGRESSADPPSRKAPTYTRRTSTAHGPEPSLLGPPKTPKGLGEPAALRFYAAALRRRLRPQPGGPSAACCGSWGPQTLATLPFYPSLGHSTFVKGCTHSFCFVSCASTMFNCVCPLFGQRSQSLPSPRRPNLTFVACPKCRCQTVSLWVG